MKKIIKQAGLTITVETDSLVDADFQDKLLFDIEDKSYVSFDKLEFDLIEGNVHLFWKNKLIYSIPAVEYYKDIRPTNIVLTGLQGRQLVNKA